MKQCPFCAEDIQDEAVVCRFCGRDLVPQPSIETPPPLQVQLVQPKKKTGCATWGVAVLFGLLFVGWCSSKMMPPVPSQFGQPNPETAARLERLFASAQQDGAIRKVDETMSYVYVDPLIWGAFNVDGKKGLAWACAHHFRSRGQTGYAHIYDYRSGKRLAKMSSAGTFALE